MSRLTGRVAIVTGAGAGIGRAIAHRFAAEGAAVAVADIDLRSAERTARSIVEEGHAAAPVHADVTRSDQVADMVETAERELGGVDTLVNNAAGDPRDGAFDLDTAVWEEDLHLTLTAPFLCARALLPKMVERGGGAIVNISSVNAHLALGTEAYSAGKAGLENLTQAIATRYGRHGVRANAIAPGTIRTDAPNWRHRLAKDPDVFQRLVRWYPLGRVGAPDDIANAALFLASEEAAWITGTVLRVDGGLLAGNGLMARDLAGEGATHDTRSPQ